MYLGAKISKKNIEGTTLRTMSSHDYLKVAIQEIEITLKKRGEKHASNASTRRLLT